MSYLVKLFTFFLFTFLTVNPIFCQCVSGDCKNGFGIKLYPDSTRFEGTFEKGFKKSGIYTYKSGDKYEGSFNNNSREGFGVYTYKNGEIFKGVYLNDKKEYGTYQFKNNDLYTGSFDNNLPSGYGVMKYHSGKIIEGYWENGTPIWDYNTDSLNQQLTQLNNVITDSSKSLTFEKNTPRFYSVIVGISDYEGSFSDLRFADNDAKIFYNNLINAFPIETKNGSVKLLLNENATCQNIQSALKSVFLQANENDYVIFYFSGHGSPGNFAPSNYSQERLSHDFVKSCFKQSKAKYKLCIADACFSGSIGNTTNQYASQEAYIRLKDSKLGVIMSSKSYQTSQETSDLKQGVFSYFFIKGMRGAADLNKDTYVTVGELFLYTKQTVSQRSNGAQVPVVFGNNLYKIPISRISK
jgi:hypothetical protein